MIFINRANDTIGKTNMWGKSKFLFHYQRRWRHLKFPSPTFWLKDEPANNHQAVILRESGPCLYRVVYKPIYLVDRIAGSGQPTPFPSEEAYCAFIKGNNFGERNGSSRFVPLQPVCHWFCGELNEGERELTSWLKRCNVNGSVANSYLDSYKQGTSDWYQIVEHREELARSAVETYFSACYCDSDDSNEDSRRGSNPIIEPEPQNWCTSEAIKQMMQVYSLLLLGANAFPEVTIKPKVMPFYHASANNKFNIAFMWGCNRHIPRTMITTYLKLMQKHCSADYISGNYLLVLVNPRGNPGLKDMLTFIKKAILDIVKGIPPAHAPSHLQQHGDVVMVNIEKGFRCICDHSLFGEFYSAENEDDLKHRLENLIKEYVTEAQII